MKRQSLRRGIARFTAAMAAATATDGMAAATAIAALVMAMTIAASAEAAIYHRFWRGVKLPSLTAEEFQNRLNDTFLSATVQTGAGKGLIAYEPALVGSPGLPDEIALVSYEDQSEYAALFATPAGQAYVALHWTLFVQAQSASAVPQPYQGTVALENAYDLQPDYAGWQFGTTVVRVGFRAPGEGDAAYLARFQSELEAQGPGVLDRVALVSSAYWLDYVSTNSDAAAVAAGAGADLMIPVDSGGLGAVHLSLNRGVNLRFDP